MLNAKEYAISTLNARKIILIMFLFIAIGCNEDNAWSPNQPKIRDKYLVDKIYDYHDNLLAEYTYDDDNRLIKKVVSDQLIEAHRTIDRYWESEFEYQNGRVSKIKTYSSYFDNSSSSGKQESNTETTFEYDLQGRLTKEDGGFLYKNGLLISTYGYTMGPCFYRDTLKYDNSTNITEHVFVGPEYTMYEGPIIGTYRVSTRHYEYDNNPKPNFGLDYLFTYNPWPYTEAISFTKCLSKNNMTQALNDGYEFVYTYNENGLPATIETKWKDIGTTEPMIMKIHYKKIK